MASGMIAWGGAVTGFINLPGAVLLSRERGELKRLRGAPLPPALYLTGRTLSVVLWSLVSAALFLGSARRSSTSRCRGQVCCRRRRS